MSIVAIGLNLLLAALLLAALAMGWRLNKRLMALRDSHDGFAKAVRELDAAAERAEQGLADLRAATDEATDALADRIEKGRALAAKLERLIDQAPAMSAAHPPQDDRSQERRLGALLAAAREARQRPERLVRSEPAPATDALRASAPLAPRSTPRGGGMARPSFEDELFEEPLTLTRDGARR